MAKRRQQIGFPRAVLLVEIERRCAAERCRAPQRIGLTKAEARAYHGFACVRCERWHDDALTERDVPDWWEELTLTDLAALRPTEAECASEELEASKVEGADAVVARLSAAWRAAQAEGEDEGDAEARPS